MKKILLFFTVLFWVTFWVSGAIGATENSSIDQKLDNQNKSIMEQLEEMESNSENGDFEEKLSGFGNDLIKGSMTIRKFAVPFYMLFVIIDLGLLITIAARSLTMRKKCLWLLVIVTFFFIAIKNLPLLMLYARVNLSSTIPAGEVLYNSVFRFIAFLRRNSFAICTLLASYGIINIILGKNDIPRKLAGHHWIKYSALLFIVLQVLPLAINFIL